VTSSLSTCTSTTTSRAFSSGGSDNVSDSSASDDNANADASQSQSQSHQRRVSSGKTLAKFLANRQAFLREKEKKHHLQSHAKGGSDASAGTKNIVYPGKQQQGGRRGHRNSDNYQRNKNQNYSHHRGHYRKGRTTKQRVRDSQEGNVQSRGRARVKHFDAGLLTKLDSEGKILDRDPVEQFYYPDFLEVSERDEWLMENGPEQRSILNPKNLNSVKPLKLDMKDDCLSAFLKANYLHNTKYAEVSTKDWHPHAESRREPIPVSPKYTRKQPPVDFVNGHNAYLFVEGFDIDRNDPAKNEEVVEALAKRFEVEKESVFSCGGTGPASAFVGFETSEKAHYNLKKHHRQVQGSPIEFKEFDTSRLKRASDAVKELVESSSEGTTFVQINNLGHKKEETHRFKIKAALKPELVLSNKDIVLTSSSSALIRVESDKIAKALLNSKKLAERAISKLGSAKMMFVSKCFREQHQRLTGYSKRILTHVPGRRLFVEGDVPEKNLYISHAGVIHLDNVPHSATKEEISREFDKYCLDRRDVFGSVELVQCAKGFPTGKAFVGFDRQEDFDAVVEAIGQNDFFVKGWKVKVQPLEDKDIPRNKKIGTRRSRPTDELFGDLYEWEHYLDPTLLDELDQMYGREMLDQVFTNLRMQNQSFGHIDQAMRGERLEPDLAPGERKKEFITKYAQFLHDFYTTPDNPGALVNCMFAEGEQVRLEIFDGKREYVNVKSS